MRIEDRSLNDSLTDGATDGKYRKSRPDTLVQPGLGGEIVKNNRGTLHSEYGYGFVNSESPSKVDPGSR